MLRYGYNSQVFRHFADISSVEIHLIILKTGSDIMTLLTKTSKVNTIITYKKKSQSAYGRGNAVSPVVSIKNSMTKKEGPEAEMIERVYEKLKILKDEYKAFYKEEQELETFILKLCENCDDFVDQLVQIFESYNKSIDALVDFDKVFDTSYIDTIREVVTKYEAKLQKISISIEPDGKLRYYRLKLKKLYNYDPSAFDFLLKDETGLIPKLFMAFHIIKAIVPEEVEEQLKSSSTEGLLIDTKC